MGAAGNGPFVYSALGLERVIMRAFRGKFVGVFLFLFLVRFYF